MDLDERISNVSTANSDRKGLEGWELRILIENGDFGLKIDNVNTFLGLLMRSTV